GKGVTLIVAEGYMDVIALSEAGFGAAVAPLGTAVTEDQLRLMWRIHPEPVIALDGDTAGIRAALRVIDLALPLLEAGQGLRFAVLPQGMDPDDVIRAQGAAAMQRVLDQAQPMVRLLWQRETEGRVFDSPERKATLDKSLHAALMRIKDTSIRGHYGEDIKRLRWELFGHGQAKPARKTERRFKPGGAAAAWAEPGPPVPSTRSSVLGNAGAGAADEYLLEALLLATLVVHPALIRHHEAALETLDLLAPGHNALRGSLLRHADLENPLEFRNLIAAEQRTVLETLFAQSHVQTAPPVRNREDIELARMCVAEGLAKLEARRRARREIEDAIEDLSGLADEGLTWRLGQATEARNRAERSNLEDVSDMGEDRAALSKHLQNLIDGEIWVKKKG
ncbi:MAG: toprim domain-containing protein, partial [Paracoccaceae bacterium]|nr:toprim domain-containing protein [Paracoccaceae bacterium]